MKPSARDSGSETDAPSGTPRDPAREVRRHQRPDRRDTEQSAERRRTHMEVARRVQHEEREEHEVEEIAGSGVRSRTLEKPYSEFSEAEKQEAQKKMEAAGTPGTAHKALDVLAGEWKAEVKCWMEPGQPPHVSQGTAKGKWTLNGHFLEEEFRGEMMGKPFTGRSLMGYDNTKQTFRLKRLL